MVEILGEIMGRKKVRVTNELIQRLENEGIESLTRGELRALFRRGYVEKRLVQMLDGSARCAYKIIPNKL